LYNKNILDIGGGFGTYLRFLKDRNTCCALEISRQAARNIVQSLSGVTVIIGDATSLPIADSSYDVVLLLDVLEHIEDDTKVLREIHRILKREGKLIFNVPEDPKLFSSIDRYNGHFRRYSKEGLKKISREAGFSSAQISNSGFPLSRLYIRLCSSVYKADGKPPQRLSWFAKIIARSLGLLFELEHVFNGVGPGIQLHGIFRK